MLKNTLDIFVRNVCRSTICRSFSTVPVPQAEEKQGNTKRNPYSNREKMNEALKSKDYFNVHNIFTVKDMFDAKVHLGHKIASADDRMKPFFFGSRLGYVIFDLDIAAYHLRKALNFCAHIAYRDGIILFVSHNKRCTTIVENTAKECKEFAYCRDWRNGTFLDPEKIFHVKARLPDLCIFLNTFYETGQQHKAVIEASKLTIPTIAVADSDCNPNLITYPVPGNDDTPSSVSFFCNVFKTAILRAKEKRIEDKLVS